jgi:hypothetical protein
VNCTICKRPLLEGATACVVCGAPVQAAVRSSLPGGPPPVSMGNAGGMSGLGGPPGGTPPLGVPPMERASVPSSFPGSAPYGGYGPAPYAAPQPLAPPPYPYAPPQPYAAPYPMAPYANQPNNMAVASFVCALFGLVPLWIGFVLCILAITFGVLGIQRAAQLTGQRGRGLAIAGLVIGILCLPLAACGL